MRIAYFCFIAAAVAALCGMSLGIWMGMGGDFRIAPAHAHLNLLGWVTLALYGLYHRGVERPSNRLAWTQVGIATAAVPLMIGPLLVYLVTDIRGFIVVAMLSSFLAAAGMVLFLAVVIADLRRAGARAPALAPRTA
jgi:hypothetical protein